PHRLTNITADVSFAPSAALQTRAVTLTMPAYGITGFSTSADSTDGVNGTWTAYTAPVTVAHGGSLYLKATLASGYTFVKWADGITQNPYRITAITADVSFTPSAALQTRAVTLTMPAYGITGFSTSADSTDGVNGIWTAYTAPVAVAHGGSLYIKATLASGYTFVKWADSISSNPYRITNITADVSFAPSAAPTRYPVTFDDNGATTPHSGGDTDYTLLTTLFTLPAAPARVENGVSYAFLGWQVTGAAQGGSGFQRGDLLTGSTRALSGCYGAVALTAVWQGAPVISADPSDQSVIEGGRAAFTVAAAGTPPLTYQWESSAGSGWTAITHATSASWEIASAQLGQNGLLVRCRVSNSDGAAVSASARLSVRRKALNPSASDNAILGVAPGQRYTQGETVAFTARGGGMDNSAPLAGDTRWLPTAWSTNPSGDFASGFTQRFSTLTISVGVHSLAVTFTRQRCTGAAWEDEAPVVRDTKTVPYQVVAAPTPPRTGDGGQPLLWLALCLLGGMGALALRKRRRS
ncbi:MAG: immunoglobulin domain-containing protein, partial [Eubacteriales bacterium]|nr:immunoglobulin domain-containing protein [Eubacteriales bacterium]